eukprot:TRINITY_DN1234_c6_g1_i1.p1 TRINITY_DN1234_c6_g1~~TRINITY_DN1234_c6_g1_i1.p1  ORF type:complete len:313 (+),score=59.82 TRINITY_DN1234_c6_g1_i1:81-941(+)
MSPYTAISLLLLLASTEAVLSLECGDVKDEELCSCHHIGNMCRSSNKLNDGQSDVCMEMTTDECPSEKCEWSSGRCQEAPNAMGCMSNEKQNCLDCMKMGDHCMSAVDPCKGHEKNCSNLHNCQLVNGTCGMVSDPCNGAKYCGDCYWTMQMCMPVEHPHGGGGTGQMIMTFFGGHDVVVLFDEIHTTTVGQYVGALIVTILGGIVAVLLKDVTARYESLGLPIRTLLMIIAFTISNLVMLIVMIMNTGLFIAAMAGSTIGWVIMETLRVKRNDVAQNIQLDCHSP